MDRQHQLRLLLVACQMASIAITSPVWEVRGAEHQLPNLPIVEGFPPIAWRSPLLFSLGVLIAKPDVGTVLHLATLAGAIAQDEARLQPEFLSIALLIAATLPGRSPAAIGRAHLSSLWIWGGLHKLLSPNYWTGTIITSTWPDAPPAAIVVGCLAIAGGETMLGLASLRERSRRWVPAAGVALHAGILLMLMMRNWNFAVWPWQVAIAAAAAVLFTGEAKPRSGWTWPAIAIPWLYYVNAIGPTLAFCLYADNVPLAAYRSSPASRPVVMDTDGLALLNVPYPSTPASCKRFLRLHGTDQASFTIHDPRLLSAMRGEHQVILNKEPK